MNVNCLAELIPSAARNYSKNLRNFNEATTYEHDSVSKLLAELTSEAEGEGGQKLETANIFLFIV